MELTANPVLLAIGLAFLVAGYMRVAGVVSILGGLVLAALGIFWR